MKEKCIIVGAGTYGQVYAEYLETHYEILGFIDDDEDLIGTRINGSLVLGDFNYLIESVSTTVSVFVPIGNNNVRVKFLTILTDNGFKTPSYIHSTAIIHPSVKLGKAIYVLPNSSIMPFTKIEDYVMISMGVNIAHHTIIQKGCFFSQGTNIGASMQIGENVFCGIGSTLMTGVSRIGRNSLIGAGAVIIRDIPKKTIVVGNPGRILEEVESEVEEVVKL